MLFVEGNRNVPVTKIRRWNIMDAMSGVAVACEIKISFI
jgi:hypothetical protein